MIDKNGRLFSKISIIDLLIIVLVLVLAVGLTYRVKNKAVLAGNSTFKVVLKVEDVRDYTVDAVQVGDVIYEQHANKIGVVSDVSYTDAKDIMEDMDGDVFLAPMNERYDLYITLDCTGRISDKGYYANGNRQLSIGGDLPIQSKYIYTTSRIIDIYEE